MKKIFVLIFSCLTIHSYSQPIEAKFNVLAGAFAVINPAIEVGVSEKGSVQIEFLGAFAEENYMGTGYPFMITMGLLEYRFYVKECQRGFYAGPNAGFDNFIINKNIVPLVRHDHHKDTYDSGYGFMFGVTAGYKFLFGERYCVDINFSGGWHKSRHDGYTKDGVLLYKRNSSGEWTPYKAGVYFTYRFGNRNK